MVDLIITKIPNSTKTVIRSIKGLRHAFGFGLAEANEFQKKPVPVIVKDVERSWAEEKIKILNEYGIKSKIVNTKSV